MGEYIQSHTFLRLSRNVRKLPRLKEKQFLYCKNDLWEIPSLKHETAILFHFQPVSKICKNSAIFSPLFENLVLRMRILKALENGHYLLQKSRSFLRRKFFCFHSHYANTCKTMLINLFSYFLKHFGQFSKCLSDLTHLYLSQITTKIKANMSKFNLVNW